MSPAVRQQPYRAAVAALALVTVLAGCSRPGEPSLLRPPTGEPSRTGGSPSRPVGGEPGQSLPARPSTSPSPSASGFSDTTVVPCNGRPSGNQVIAVVRRAGLLPASASVIIRTGPVCSGTWQYTVLAVAEREPLQVVTRGSATSLTLVTAGTDVCTPDVLVAAPVALRTAANC